MDRFRTMESFVRVARSGSFTLAANQLGLSRALISRHIGDLEARLGVRLLTRSTRSLNLTEEGRSYLDFCERIFREIEASERGMLRARDEPTGTLRLAGPKSFGALHLADAMVEFAHLQPRLRISFLLEDVSFRRPSEFVERGLDLALWVSSQSHTSLAEQEIVLLDWVLCAAPAYLAQAGRPAIPADLAGHACLIHSNVAANDLIWRFIGPKGPVTVKVAGRFFSNSAQALRKAALGGLGIALVPRYSVAGDLAGGALVPLLPRYRVEPRPLLAVFPRAAQVPQKVQVFVDFLRGWMLSRDIDGRPGRRVAARL